MDRLSARNVRRSLWFIPVLCVVAGLVLSFVTVAVDRAFDYELIPEWMTGGPDAAVAILSTIAASMVSLAALVLTITMVVVQLAMGQFSPRIVQTILRDKPSQIAIGLFIATFAHAMVSLREVHADDPPTVPGLAIVVAYVLVLFSIVVLVLYVHHIGQSLRVSALIEMVGSTTRDLLDEQYPQAETPKDERDPRLVLAPISGVVCEVRHERLVRIAAEADCCVELVPALGQFVPAGSPLFVVHGPRERLDGTALTDEVLLGLERTLEHDAAYGFRMLVDIAERCISESPFQDPTTSVQAIDRLHDCLRQLASRSFPDGTYRDERGEVRLRVPVMCWDDYVVLAFEEIRLAGATSPQVSRRLVAALQDLLDVAPPDRHRELERQLRLLRAGAEASVEPGDELSFDLRPDPLGIGVAANDGASDSRAPAPSDAR